MKKEITISAAFDRRDSDPSKNYGVHGCEMRFVLSGRRGAMQFVLYTNWMLPHVTTESDESFLAKARRGQIDEVDLRIRHPLPADLGYHSPKPMYDGHKPMKHACEYLGGKPCYYDGSGLAAQSVYEQMLKGGSDAVWKRLEHEYVARFGKLL